MDEFVAGSAVPRNNHILFDKVNLHIQLVEQDVVLKISKETVGLFRQERPTRGVELSKVRKHGHETCATGLLGGLHIDELRIDADVLLLGVLPQEGLLGRDAEAF